MYPHPGVLGQRVPKRLKRNELSFGACQRVRKSVKRKNLNKMRARVAVSAEGFPNWEEGPHTLRCSHKSGKCGTYGIRNLEECTENGKGSALGPECSKVMSNYHTTYCHMSTIFVKTDLKGIFK